jgi:hypothetical protein
MNRPYTAAPKQAHRQFAAFNVSKDGLEQNWNASLTP